MSDLHQPRRALIGHCPECVRIVIVTVGYGESWPLVRCECGWIGDTFGPLNRAHYETDGTVERDEVTT